MQILNLFTFKGNTKKRLLIWMWVTRLTKLLGKSEIPAAILKYCFSGSLFIWDRRVTPRRHLGKKSRDLGYIGELTIVPCKHFFLGYSARRDEILLKAHAFGINKRKWRKSVLNPEERGRKKSISGELMMKCIHHKSNVLQIIKLVSNLLTSHWLVFSADISEAHINTIKLGPNIETTPLYKH